jgi:hypothetical protein
MPPIRRGYTIRVGDGEQTVNPLLSLHPMYPLRVTNTSPHGRMQTRSPLIAAFKYLVKHLRHLLHLVARLVFIPYYMYYIGCIMSSITDVISNAFAADKKKEEAEAANGHDDLDDIGWLASEEVEDDGDETDVVDAEGEAEEDDAADDDATSSTPPVTPKQAVDAKKEQAVVAALQNLSPASGGKKTKKKKSITWNKLFTDKLPSDVLTGFKSHVPISYKVNKKVKDGIPQLPIDAHPVVRKATLAWMMAIVNTSLEKMDEDSETVLDVAHVKAALKSHDCYVQGDEDDD